jgi:hypothetical protein
LEKLRPCEPLQKKAIPMFSVLHPNCDGIFLFDNSQNHHAKPPDALSAAKMNLTDGDASQLLMRNGWFSNSNRERIEQKMVLDDGVTFKGRFSVSFRNEVYGPDHEPKTGSKAALGTGRFS